MRINPVPYFLSLSAVVALASMPIVAEQVVAGSDNMVYAPVTVEMQPIKLSERTYYVQGRAGAATDYEGFISNAGFVITDSSVIVFDALGTPSLAWELVQKIRSISDKPITKVIVSHYHADHVLGLEVFKKLGAQIIAPERGASHYIDTGLGAERLEERRVSLDPWVNDDTVLVPPDQWLKESTSFTEGGVTFDISLLGKAHSYGDLALLIKPDNVLYSGDIIFEGRVPFVGNADTKGWLKTLTDLQTGGLTALVPGHGPAASDPKVAIELTRNYIAFLRSIMGTAVDELQDFDEVYSETDWSAFSHLPAFEESNRLNAYAVYLSMSDESLQ
jgi:glyoxylase-like metal-dependent hydrolase (beta-lactamase superfamily II)